MALQINITDSRVGLPAPEAYARIVGVNIDIEKGEAHVAVHVFANRAAANANKAPIDGASFRAELGPAGIDIDMPNGLRFNAYTFLKTLPAFSASQDV